jgi:pimeloyl-ACP methyl ester carboxylesterase
MKPFTVAVFIFFYTVSFGQEKRPEDFGFRHLRTIYKGDTVDILVKSKKGEELKPKPLFLFCQGSLPQPLIKYDEKGMFGVFTFNPDDLAVDYHLAIISKPGVPVVARINTLGQEYTYSDGSGAFPKAYTDRNHLDYYVNRNIQVIQFLQRQSWVSTKILVVAGHSEGSSIAAKMASAYSKITHLIYSGGNPMGRILTLIGRERAIENESSPQAEGQFKYWEQVVSNPSDTTSKGDTHRATYEFSIPPIHYLQKLKIPVLVCYGTKDVACPFNDYLRVEVIKQKKSNFTFKAYIGTEHNYFPVKPTGEVDYDTFNWDKVARDWKQWLLGATNTNAQQAVLRNRGRRMELQQHIAIQQPLWADDNASDIFTTLNTQ